MSSKENDVLTLDEVLSDFRVYCGYSDQTEVTVDSRGNGGDSPLHWMASLGDQFAIQLLVAAGANVNAVDDSGNTPIHEAVSGRQSSAVSALTAAGADLTLRNKKGQTPMDIARTDGFQPTIDLLVRME